ncbi:aldose 1-epimerase family protein [Flavobacterium litorale]|uniref:Aldose 1-epimerase family protein n=1 Tax=Flavobacterium litorale TaxID=2856519 RepID=A0ABX8V5E8_9FLAO|nr:aldose 1-epimerase family protein [Flavobacterium litorale]QYJ68030.1 aldose 1-epimerase family protein [Flavobacterium litorale]
MTYSIKSNCLTATFNTKGAELTSLKNNNNKEYIWEANPQYWGKHSPVLFPIVGVLKNNSYTYNGKTYTLSRHGFARDKVFSVKEQHDDTITFVLAADEATKENYPFNFELQIKYTLAATTLCIDYIVSNKGATTMPFSIGGHPAFALPNNFKDYSLQFEKQEDLVSTQLQNELLSGIKTPISLKDSILPLNYNLFKNDALIFKQLQSETITILEENKPFLKVAFSDFPHLGIWTKPNYPFLCIEPWQGYADSVNSNGKFIEKEGSIVLAEKATIQKGFSIEILN